MALALAVLICNGDGSETWDSLEHLLLFSKSSLIPPLLSLRGYSKLSWADPKFLTRALRVGSPIKKTFGEARPVEESVNSKIGMIYTYARGFLGDPAVDPSYTAGLSDRQRKDRLLAESFNIFAELLPFSR